MAYLLIAILPVPVCTEPNISCSHDPIHHRPCEMTGEEGGEVEEEGGWGDGREREVQYITVYHSTPQYTTVHHSISQYTTVYHSIPQCITVYHSICRMVRTAFSTEEGGGEGGRRENRGERGERGRGEGGGKGRMRRRSGGS